MKFYCVTPCYNAEEYIEETMLSVLSQSALEKTENSLHYIIQDGASTDRTEDVVNNIILKYQDKTNIEIKYNSEPDSGMYDALGKAFDHDSQSDIYSYINAGDYYSKHAFEIITEIFKNHDVYFLTGINITYNEKGHLVNFRYPFEYNKNFLLKGYYGTKLAFVQQEATFWYQSIHKKIDLNQLRTYKYAGDYYIWKTLITFSPLYIVYAWIGGFKVHTGQLSSIFQQEYRNEMLRISDPINWKDELIVFFYKKAFKRIHDDTKIKLSPYIFQYNHAENKYNLSKHTKRHPFLRLFHYLITKYYK